MLSVPAASLHLWAVSFECDWYLSSLLNWQTNLLDQSKGLMLATSNTTSVFFPLWSWGQFLRKETHKKVEGSGGGGGGGGRREGHQASHSIHSFDKTLTFSSHFEPLIDWVVASKFMAKLNLQCDLSWRPGVLEVIKVKWGHKGRSLTKQDPCSYKKSYTPAEGESCFSEPWFWLWRSMRSTFLLHHSSWSTLKSF